MKKIKNENMVLGQFLNTITLDFADRDNKYQKIFHWKVSIGDKVYSGEGSLTEFYNDFLANPKATNMDVFVEYFYFENGDTHKNGILNFIPAKNAGKNSMGCSESWYNSYYAIQQAFTKDEIEKMSHKEINNLIHLAETISENLY